MCFPSVSTASAADDIERDFKPSLFGFLSSFDHLLGIGSLAELLKNGRIAGFESDVEAVETCLAYGNQEIQTVSQYGLGPSIRGDSLDFWEGFPDKGNDLREISMEEVVAIPQKYGFHFSEDQPGFTHIPFDFLECFLFKRDGFVHRAECAPVPGTSPRDADQGASRLVWRPVWRKIVHNISLYFSCLRAKSLAAL
jgi:hypothetical protein